MDMYNNYFQIYLSIQINLHRLFPLCPSQLLLTVKKKCPVRKNYGPVRINYGPVRINYGPVRKNYGPVRINYGPVRKNHGPVRKNHEMGHFAYKNTYNEAIFDL